MSACSSLVFEVLDRNGNLAVAASSIEPDASLFKLGMSSFQAVQVMMALEETMGIQFTDDLIRKESFESISAICATVEQLRRINCSI